MNSLALFASAFVQVFCLGMQSLLVNNGHRAGAFINSFAIGACNLVMLKLAPGASGIEVAAYLSGGPIAIVSAMEVFGWWRRQRARGAA